jgi:hypothetical protein
MSASHVTVTPSIAVDAFMQTMLVLILASFAVRTLMIASASSKRSRGALDAIRQSVFIGAVVRATLRA